MATTTRIVFLELGVPTVSQSTLVLYETGQAGEVGAKRVLTHPNGDDFSAIAYYKNPTRTFNLDNQVLVAPRSDAVPTLGSRQVVRFERGIDDVIVTEVWEGAENRRAAMPTSLWRQLYEYLRNPPAFDPVTQTFITWAPRDRTTLVYNVQLYQIRVGGGGSDEQIFDIDDVRLPASTEVKNPLETMDVTPDGFLTRNVQVKLHIVSLVGA